MDRPCGAVWRRTPEPWWDGCRWGTSSHLLSFGRGKFSWSSAPTFSCAIGSNTSSVACPSPASVSSSASSFQPWELAFGGNAAHRKTLPQPKFTGEEEPAESTAFPRDVDTCKDEHANVVLAGGTACSKGLGDRMPRNRRCLHLSTMKVDSHPSLRSCNFTARGGVFNAQENTGNPTIS